MKKGLVLCIGLLSVFLSGCNKKDNMYFPMCSKTVAIAEKRITNEGFEKLGSYYLGQSSKAFIKEVGEYVIIEFKYYVPEMTGKTRAENVCRKTNKTYFKCRELVSDYNNSLSGFVWCIKDGKQFTGDVTESDQYISVIKTNDTKDNCYKVIYATRK